MLKLWQSKGTGYNLHFLTPDDGGGSGGGGGASGDTKTGEEDIKTPFDDIDLEELDEATRTKITEGKKQFIATLQRTTKLNTDLEHVQSLARRFQGEADKAKAEYEKLTGKGRNSDENPVLEGVKNDLKASGYADADVEKMAPTFLRLFKTFGGAIRTEIGKDLSPMAGSVLAQEATTAFTSAQNNDPLGALQIPEVAEKTWGLVQERIKSGTQTTPVIVANLAKMAFMDYAAEKAAKGETIELRTFNTPAKPATPGLNTNFTYPGSGTVRPTVTPTREGQAVHVLNEDTQNALASTFGEMGRGTGVYPKAFPEGSGKKGGRK